MRVILLISFIFFNLTARSQKCNLEDYLDVFFKASIRSDVYYFLDFEKDSVPFGEIFFSEEQLKFNESTFESLDGKSVNLTTPLRLNMMVKNNELGTPELIAFNTGIVDNKIVFEILFYREDYLTDQNATSVYEKYKKYNAGIRYYFHLDNTGCIKKIIKKPVNYG